MICPRCNTQLTITNTQGVEIDYCPNCKGVWLDRGELDKIIERSNSYGTRNMFGNEHREHNEHHESPFDNHHGHSSHGYGNQTKHHKKGFLSDLFDF